MVKNRITQVSASGAYVALGAHAQANLNLFGKRYGPDHIDQALAVA